MLGFLPVARSIGGDGSRAADAWRYQGRPGAGQRRLASEASRERRTTAQTATDAPVTATARSIETRTAPTTRTTAVPAPTRARTAPGVSWTVGRVDAAGAGAGVGWCWT